jgi:dipeptidase E
MKLYLSSYRIPDTQALFDLVGKEPHDIRTAVIPNAKDYYADRARAVKIRDVTDYLQNLGLKAEAVDLRRLDSADAVKNALQGFDLLWVMGGNTFCLMHEILRGGFDRALPELLESGVVYAGESAGAVAVGTSLKGIEKADNPEFAESVIYAGLSVVPYFVLPHVDDESFAEDVQASRAAHPDPKTRLELTNAQAAIFDGDNMRVVTGLY